ncbi:MAG: SDR family NAD(P)-dependent oxidoreductase, partial [Myxococcales bacterium]|nr:SDR family NAD(P)-dependent oxidoreductase [Myxococcales bacterium]
AEKIGGGAFGVPTDVTVRADVERLRDEALARAGRVDVWVNNAGRGITKSLLALGDDDVDAMVRDNVKSALYGMQAIVPHLQSRGDGTVANVSSMLSRVPFAPIRSAYSACKAALNSLTETLRIELRDTHPKIRVITVLPGVVATDFGNKALGGGPDSRALPGAQEVGEVARVIADALLTRNGDVYTRPGAEKVALGHIEQLASG